MTTPQDLYPNIPPTVLRNRKEVFRKPRNSKFWHWVADNVFYRMIENRFFSIMVKNEDNVKQCNPDFATIFYAPHRNWWDGILTYNMDRRVLKHKKYRIMVEEMNRFPLFQMIGAYPINKKSAQTAMESLRYTAQHILDDKEVSLWIFPQGIIRPPSYKPEKFQKGLAYMVENSVKKYGGINLQPVAFHYCFLREDKPEILVEFDKPKVITECHLNKKEITEKLERDFEVFCNQQVENLGCGNFEGYRYVYRQKLHWWKVIEKKLRSIGMKGNIRT